ncbi:MAG: hypothetical protein KDA28_16145, partial [Phycisphaerales bacterium]|nr:hypothetical protein [Phycisphaerales bacterium]
IAIIHGEHQPATIVLTGGIGVRMAPFAGVLGDVGPVRFGADDHHGARGAARLVQRSLASAPKS